MDRILRNLQEKWYRALSIFIHFPKDRNCEVWRTKNARASCRSRTSNQEPRAEKFGDLITADFLVLNEDCESRNNQRYAVVVQDLATQWLQSYPCKTKSSQGTGKSLRMFLELSEKLTVIYTDNSLEFGKACEELSWNQCKSTAHRSETNGIAERARRRIMEGTFAADSMECYCHVRKVQNLLSHGKTIYELFCEPTIPFGSMIEYNRIFAKDQ